MKTKRACEICHKPLPDKPYRPSQKVHKECRRLHRNKLGRDRWAAGVGDATSKIRRGPRFRQAQNAWAKKRRQEVKQQVIEHYGGCCDCCGEEHQEFLSIDHVNGGGRKHRREENLDGGAKIYYWLIRQSYPEGFRVLCHNCNLSLGLYGYCPHQA